MRNVFDFCPGDSSKDVSVISKLTNTEKTYLESFSRIDMISHHFKSHFPIKSSVSSSMFMFMFDS